jgi:hypothetical protein
MLSNFNKKSYEICYAIFRLAGTIKHTDLRSRLEKAGLDVLESTSGDNLLRLETLVLFGQGIGEIGYPQSQVLLREIGNLNAAIRQNNAAIAELDLEECFSTPSSPVVIENKENKEIMEKDKENSAMRQSAIVDIMRQVQNCRIKDLIAAFPGISERTLRYDLQKLCETGAIERMGTGGPGTYYQLKAVTLS